MKVLVTGGSGFLGRAVVPALSARGAEVHVLTRSSSRSAFLGVVPGVRILEGDVTREGAWQAHVSGMDAVVHLAGQGVLEGPWSEDLAEHVAASRTRAAREVARAVEQAERPPKVVVFASSAAVYGTRPDVVDERAPLVEGRFAEPFRRAEAAMQPAASRARLVALRLGQLIGPGGGILSRFRTREDVPAPSSEGWSWIHLVDAVSLVDLALDKSLRGAMNVSAPEPVDVAALAASLSTRLPRGEGQGLLSRMFAKKKAAEPKGGGVLFVGQRARPSAALALGYAFKHGKLESALKALDAQKR